MCNNLQCVEFGFICAHLVKSIGEAKDDLY